MQTIPSGAGWALQGSRFSFAESQGERQASKRRRGSDAKRTPAIRGVRNRNDRKTVKKPIHHKSLTRHRPKGKKSPIPPGKYYDEALLRLFFLDAIPRRERLEVMGEYLRQLSARKEEIENLMKESRERKIPSSERKGYAFRMLTADFGLRYMELEQEFYGEVIQKIKGGDL